MADQKKREAQFNVFHWMDRYKVPILLLILVGMAFFGVIGYVIKLFQGPTEREKKMAEIVTSYEVGGEKREVSRQDIHGQEIRNEDEAEAWLGHLIRADLAETVDTWVSDAEFRDALDNVKEFIRTSNEGKFDERVYTRFCNAMRMTPQGFERQLREDMRLVKVMRELDRATGRVSSKDLVEQFKKDNQRVKLTGVFWDPRAYSEELARDDDEKLTAEARAKVVEYFDGLEEDQKRRFHTGGAILSAELVGFDFKKYSDDAELEAAFKAKREGARKTLEELTADFAPTDDDFAKMKLRYQRTRSEYGDAATDDLDAKFEERKPRLVIEWKILKLMKRIHGRLLESEKAGEDIDFADVAKENGLEYGTWTDRKVQDIVSDEEFPGVYVYQLQGAEENTVFTWNTGVGPNTSSLFRGPVDEVAKHASIFRLQKKDLRPIANIEDPDVLDKVAEEYRTTKAKEGLDEDVEAFEKAMDDFLEAIDEVAEARKTARSDADASFAEESEGLDPEKDAEKLEELKKKYDDEVEAAADDAKSEHRGEAFDAVVADLPGKAVVVTEGFFEPRLVTRESQLQGDDWPAEQIASNLLRTQFRELHDQPYADKYIDVGTVGEITDIRVRRGWKGIAKVAEKKEPTLHDLFSRPLQLTQTEGRVARIRNPSGTAPSMWDWDSLKHSGFKIDTARIEAAIREEIDRESEEDRRLEELKRLREERSKEKQKEEAQKAEDERKKREAEDAAEKAEELANPDGASGDGAGKDAGGESKRGQ